MILRRIALCTALATPALGTLTLAICSCGSGDDSTDSDGGDRGSPDATASAEAGAPGQGTSSTDGGVGDAATSAATDGAVDGATDAGSDASSVGLLTACAPALESDGGALSFSVPNVPCFTFTPVDTGEPASGENATMTQYALRPAGGVAPSRLVLFLIGSGGRPSGALKAGPTSNLYAAAVADGNAVFGVSYKNSEAIGDICGNDDSCFFPTRESILLGTPERDAGLTATLDESVVDRTAHALRYLAAGDPTGGWGAFLTSTDPTTAAAQAIDWTKVIAAGHSQGGGHATALGKLFPVARVIQLSSTCDSAADFQPASWTNGAAAPWASDPQQFYGLAAPSYLDDAGKAAGDTTCPWHTENWTNLGMVDSHRDNAAATCGVAGDTHNESLWCPDNYPAWVTLLK